jgi:hypothetical protein
MSASIFSYVFFHNSFLIRRWNLPLDPPGFLDSRQFAWASEAYAQGYDPLIENPVNPNGHQLNYPRIWHILFHLGINESHTNLIGSIVVILFFIGIGIFWFSKKYDNLTYLILSIAFLSPAVMLGVERSNIELILFFLLSIALLVNYYSSISALSLFIFASVLKVYPVFSFFYLLKENKRRFWMLFPSASGIFFLYALLSLDDFKQVYRTTPKLAGSSFGINVWWMGLSSPRFFNLPMSDNMALYLNVISHVLALLILIAALYYGMRQKDAALYDSHGNHIDAFRVGAGIYIGCFLTMNTHDYRLIFLIFTIPQLVAWARNEAKGILSVPLITLITMIFSIWSAFIMHFLGRNLTFAMEEFANWIVLAGLLYLFFISLPDWFKDYLRRPVSLIRSPDRQMS